MKGVEPAKTQPRCTPGTNHNPERDHSGRVFDSVFRFYIPGEFKKQMTFVT